jgi:hypothetical protein
MTIINAKSPKIIRPTVRNRMCRCRRRG